MVKGKHYFYVLYCRDNTLYAGYSNNLKQRVEDHNSGRGAKYTRVTSRRPVQLIYAEQWETKSLAMQAEYAFKQKSRPQKERYLAEHGQGELTSQNPVFYIGYRHQETRDIND